LNRPDLYLSGTVQIDLLRAIGQFETVRHSQFYVIIQFTSDATVAIITISDHLLSATI